MRCIFCKQNSSNSKSIEHIIPESIGNKRWVLPKGVVCDNCNNYFAVKVEGPLLNHLSFNNVRAYYQVPNKKNKIPTLKGVFGGIDISLKLNKEKKIEIKPVQGKQLEEFHIEYSKFLNGKSFNPFIFKVEIEPPEELMSRFLAKMSVEMMAYKFIRGGNTTVPLIDEKFLDPIRNYARFGDKPKFWIYKSRRIFPMDTLMEDNKGEYVQIGYGCDLFQTKRKETYFFFLFYGIEFVINIGGNSILGYEEWLMENKQISPTLERTGSKVVSKKEGNKTRYYIEGDLNSLNGILFDKEQMKYDGSDIIGE